jgi:hypothetical protein
MILSGISFKIHLTLRGTSNYITAHCHQCKCHHISSCTSEDWQSSISITLLTNVSSKYFPSFTFIISCGLHYFHRLHHSCSVINSIEQSPSSKMYELIMYSNNYPLIMEPVSSLRYLKEPLSLTTYVNPATHVHPRRYICPCSGRECIFPFILNLSTDGSAWLAQRSCRFDPRESNLQYPLNKRLGRLQTPSGSSGEANTLHLPGTEPRFLGRLACSLVTLPPTLSWVHFIVILVITFLPLYREFSSNFLQLFV